MVHLQTVNYVDLLQLREKLANINLSRGVQPVEPLMVTTPEVKDINMFADDTSIYSIPTTSEGEDWLNPSIFY